MSRDESADTTGLRDVIAAEVWRIHGPESTDKESAEMDGEDIARAILASDWLANHVAATREADRAERLAGLVAKIEAEVAHMSRAGGGIYTPDFIAGFQHAARIAEAKS